MQVANHTTNFPKTHSHLITDAYGEPINLTIKKQQADYKLEKKSTSGALLLNIGLKLSAHY